MNVTNEKVNERKSLYKLRLYSHCTKGIPNSVTLIAINLRDDSVQLNLNQITNEAIDAYIMTPGDTTIEDPLLSSTIKLNGKILQMNDDDTLPELIPVSMENSVTLDPLTFGFFVMKEAKMESCALNVGR